MDYEYMRADGIGFFIFVIIVIVVNVIKKLAAGQTQDTTTVESSQNFKAPQDELNEFLKSIAQVQGTAQAPPPPAAAPMQTKPKPRPAPPPAPAPVLPPAAAPRQPKPVRVPHPVAAPADRTSPVPAYAATKALTASYDDRKAARSIATAARAQTPETRPEPVLQLLENRGTLQQAIVAREILGPPVALKRRPER